MPLAEKVAATGLETVERQGTSEWSDCRAKKNTPNLSGSKSYDVMIGRITGGTQVEIPTIRNNTKEMII